MEDIKMKAEQIAAEMAAAKAEATEAKAEVATLKAEIEQKGADLDAAKTSINNLDVSVKEQAKTIEALRMELSARPADFKRDFRRAFYAQKDAITRLVNEKKDQFNINVELKNVVSIGTNTAISGADFLGVQVDGNIHATPAAANAFIVAFGLRQRTGNKLGWIEATSQNAADYVAELAQNTNKSDVTFVEKTRAFGKIATYMVISTEMEDWFDQLYNYCVNEGARLIEAKLDAEIYGGAGSDATYPNKLYGLKGAATAFSALAAGAIPSANVADVLLDAADQVKKAGYNANVAFLTWANYRVLRNLKDANGNYIFDQVNNLLNGMRVYPSDRLTSGEALVADTTCAEVYAGNSYELEFQRDGAYDAYNVFFRKAAQVKVPTPKAKGIIYVASVTTAIAALTPSS